LIAQKVRTGDPYSGRLASGAQPLVTFQLDYPDDTALYAGLGKRDLRHYGEALRRCLVLLGVRPGDTLALLDYGTSPVVYLMSVAYTPHLKRGAADALECTVVCNDGVPSMSSRAVEILRYVQPRYVFVRSDCLQPFLSTCEAEHLKPGRYTEALVVTHNDGATNPMLLGRPRTRLDVPIYHLPRCDLAFFMAMECPHCRLLHSWRDLYLLEVVGPDGPRPAGEGSSGRLVITSRFARTCRAVRVLSQLEGQVVAGGCPRGPDDLRLCA